MAEPSPAPGDASKRDPVESRATTSTAQSARTATIAERAVVINMGQIPRKKIKQLKRGTGKLVEEVRDAVELAAARLGDEASGKVLVPTVVVYREKPPKKVRRGGAYGVCPVCCI
jgi:hypothetical protein